MIDIMLRGIVNNATNVEKLAKHIEKNEVQLGLCVLLITGCIYISGKIISKHEERIESLENAINDIKLKGE